MSVGERLLIAAAAMLLAGMLMLPVWRITLSAPQYPEGMGLVIWADRIEGLYPHDLQRVNGLNHYIGMAPIVPEQIPELRIIPRIVLGMLVVGLLVAAAGRRALLAVWVFTLIGLCVTGLVDFYLWGYEYGHNLDPHAPIKVPGMAYQPPLIGPKTMLNITAWSLPDLGTAAAALSLLLALGVLLRPAVERRWADRARRTEEG